MRFFLRNWRGLVSITALGIGIVSLTIGSCSLNRSYQTSKILNETSKTLQDVSKTQQERSGEILRDVNKTMQETSKTLRDVNTLLNTFETRTQNAEEASISIWYSWNLMSITKQEFIKERQELAANSKPPYVEPLNSIEFKTTLEGRGLLTPEQIQEVIRLVAEDNNIPEDRVILKLGIEKLLLQAKSHQVSLDIVIGVVASYTQEQKHKTP